jgi:aldose 1-epimerase
MHVASDQPGVQLYTGNYMDGEGAHSKHGGLCLETQAFPDAINQWPDQVVLLPNQTWTSTTVHTFGVV